ncbi:hypothetical protein EV361DRAFT_379583 [Lentinula raphanica]|nr:hypothetical protein EV361DRAFT_379583 [Lentinula raphanica]
MESKAMKLWEIYSEKVGTLQNRIELVRKLRQSLKKYEHLFSDESRAELQEVDEHLLDGLEELQEVIRPRESYDGDKTLHQDDEEVQQDKQMGDKNRKRAQNPDDSRNQNQARRTPNSQDSDNTGLQHSGNDGEDHSNGNDDDDNDSTHPSKSSGGNDDEDHSNRQPSNGHDDEDQSDRPPSNGNDNDNTDSTHPSKAGGGDKPGLTPVASIMISSLSYAH